MSLLMASPMPYSVFFFNDTATTEIYTLPLHDAFPISQLRLVALPLVQQGFQVGLVPAVGRAGRSEEHTSELQSREDISYAVLCLKKNREVAHRALHQLLLDQLPHGSARAVQ